MLYILHALPTCFFDDVKPNLGSQKAGPVRLELETNEVERVSVRCEGLFWPIQFLGPMMIGKPCVGSWAGVPGHLRICAKKMAIYKGISSTATIAHIDNCFPARVATPRRRKNHGGALAFTNSMDFYIATISGARSFAIWRSCTCQIKKRNAHDQADAFYALNSILRPLHFVFSRLYLPGSNAQSLHGTWKICHNVRAVDIQEDPRPIWRKFGVLPPQRERGPRLFGQALHFFCFCFALLARARAAGEFYKHLSCLTLWIRLEDKHAQNLASSHHMTLCVLKFGHLIA